MRMLARPWRRAEDIMFAQARYAQPLLATMALVGCIAMLAFYPLWTYLAPQPYENLPLRIAGAAVLLPVVLRRWWPRRWQRWLPIYWYAAITFVLPFFVGYMTLRNGGSGAWLLTHMVAIFLTMMLFDLASFLVVFSLGTVLAILAYLLGPPADAGVQPLVIYLPAFALALALGPMASRSQKFADRARVKALTAASNNIAHELRTPLGALQIAGAAVQRLLPDLLESRRLAIDAGLPVPELRPAQLQALETGMTVIEQEVRHAHVVIDMLLMAARPLGQQVRQPVRVRECLREALARYPYASRRESDKVSLSADAADFTVLGNQTLLQHVLFNLLRNALLQIDRAGRGAVTVDIQTNATRGRIRVTDTGPGIPPDVLPRIFYRFYSYQEDDEGVAGLGIGLAFVREAVEQMGGSIGCQSRWGEFTRFTLTFPLLTTDAHR